MSLHTTETTGKKRKKTQVVEPEEVRTAKKPRQHAEDPSIAKKEKKDKKKKKTKGKSKEVADSEFRVTRATLVVSLSPVFASNPRAGVEEMLDSMIMRYIPSLQGVVLAHSNLQFLEANATIKGDCPFAISRIAFDATVWSPYVGQKLTGRVNLCSPDHVSLLIHRTFNVSIPRHHIPTDHWEFEYGPAENDPEFGPHAVPEGEDQNMSDAHDDPPNEHEMDGGGRWVHKITGDKMGGVLGDLEFTVIGLTVANQMLSLLGSIQPDPFSPLHVPENIQTSQPSREASSEPVPPVIDDEDHEMVNDDSDDDEEDTFGRLGRMGDEAAAQEAARRAAVEKQAEEEAKKAKKKKRKAEKVEGEEETVKKGKKAKRKKAE
ncbi:hypothetical protein JAAARDRAFT_133675 [Jaapia argillacea MUCL 33604]|uniref:RPA43 OB domain-containing protein n=1 Tax=Jaapia argillacea MUCL 33604 TaxID=933084 RepID=A0A067PZU0_9AGAM|nr:hypothetical protein JAAARDRAFT_133675 [Jaapia argillacea MUCL 33604]